MLVRPPHRKRMRRREIPGAARFLTFSCSRRLPLFDTDQARDVMVEALAVAKQQFGFTLHAWVIMPEHVHILVRPQAHPVAPILKSMKVSVQQTLFALWKRQRSPILQSITTPRGVPRFWQPGGGYDHNIRSEASFSKTINYIHRNPVKRKLVERPQDWAWSSVHWWLGQRDQRPACDPPASNVEWRSWKGFM